MAWMLAGAALLVIIIDLFILRGRKRPDDGPAVPDRQPKRVTVPLLRPAQVVDGQGRVFDPDGGSVAMDYDPDRDGEFQGNPAMLGALAAVNLGGTVFTDQQDDGSWVMTGPSGLSGRGETISQAYADIMRQAARRLN